MKETNKKVAVIDVPVRDIVEVVNPYDKMIERAITSEASMETLEKFLDLKDRHEQNEARKAYYMAMAKFKANPPEIEKDGKVGFKTSKGVTSYSHATLGNVCYKINKALGLHGLSASWRVVQADNGSIKVTCLITHEQGFSESTSLVSPPETSGTKNSIQAIGSTITYLERYTLLALSGLATKDQDDDAITAEPAKPIECIDEKQESQLVDMILNFGQTIEAFCKLCNVTELKEIPKSEFKGCVASLTPIGD